MDTYMHKTMASVVSMEKIEIIRSQEFMLSEMRLKFLKKMIILGPKMAILGPQFCRILVLGPHFWWSGGPGPLPGSAPGIVSLSKVQVYRTPCDYFCLLLLRCILWHNRTLIETQFKYRSSNCREVE